MGQLALYIVSTTSDHSTSISNCLEQKYKTCDWWFVEPSITDEAVAAAAASLSEPISTSNSLAWTVNILENFEDRVSEWHHIRLIQIKTSLPLMSQQRMLCLWSLAFQSQLRTHSALNCSAVRSRLLCRCALWWNFECWAQSKAVPVPPFFACDCAAISVRTCRTYIWYEDGMISSKWQWYLQKWQKETNCELTL